MDQAFSDEIVLRYADDFSTVFEAMLDVVNQVGKADKPQRKDGILSGTVTASMPFSWSQIRVEMLVFRADESTKVRIRTSGAELAPGELQRLAKALKVVTRFVAGRKELALLSVDQRSMN